jgi:hypothetical protein
VNFDATTLCIASQQVIPNVRVYFVIDSVRKLLDTPSYTVEKEEQLALQFRVRKMSIGFSARRSDYPKIGCSWFSSVTSRQMLAQYLKAVHSRSSLHPYFIFHKHPFIGRYVIMRLESAIKQDNILHCT